MDCRWKVALVATTIPELLDLHTWKDLTFCPQITTNDNDWTIVKGF